MIESYLYCLAYQAINSKVDTIVFTWQNGTTILHLMLLKAVYLARGAQQPSYAVEATIVPIAYMALRICFRSLGTPISKFLML